MLSESGRSAGRFGLIAPLLLVVIALVYYATYYRAGFNLADDGSVVLLSQRLLNGERPLVDLMLGYNVLWFYPITALFQVFGVSLIVARIWFFTLHAVTALLCYVLLFRVTRRAWFAFAIALVVLLIPGTNNKAYIPLMVVANALCLTHLIQHGTSLRRRCWAALAGGIVLGATLLTRVDIGVFFAVIWAGVLLLSLFVQAGWGERLVALPASIAIFVAAILAVHLPVYFNAQARGFGGELIGQYAVYCRFLSFSAHQAAAAPAAKSAVSARDVAKAVPAAATTGPANMARKPVSDIWKAKRLSRRAPPFLTYAPVVSFGLILGGSLLLFGLDLAAGRSGAFQEALLHGTLAGAALTTFSQFFFFRPDLAHLSEFMPGTIVAIAAFGSALAARAMRGSVWMRGVAGLALLFLLLHLVFYIVFALPQPSTGTIALGRGRTQLFHAQNGVDVYLTPAEFDGMSKLRDAVEQNSTETDYVVCYPYSPGVNFMTNRRTYEKNLYFDNGSHPRTFNEQTIGKIEQFRPAVITINDWAINRTDASRFGNWAKPVMEYIPLRYDAAGTFFRHQVYTRRRD